VGFGQRVYENGCTVGQQLPQEFETSWATEKVAVHTASWMPATGFLLASSGPSRMIPDGIIGGKGQRHMNDGTGVTWVPFIANTTH